MSDAESGDLERLLATVREAIAHIPSQPANSSKLSLKEIGQLLEIQNKASTGRRDSEERREVREYEERKAIRQE